MVHNVKELEMLLICNKFYCAEIVHTVPSKNTEPSWKEQPSQPSVIIPVPGCTGKRIDRQFVCMLYFINKTIKLQKKDLKKVIPANTLYL